MVDAAHLLETLRPLREPQPPPSIAPVLITLALGCTTALAISLVGWRMRRRRGALRSAATAALAATRGLAPHERLAAQARVLRRLMRSAGGESAAAQQDDAWLARLDAFFDTSFFTHGDGSIYGAKLYRRPEGIDVEALDRALLGLFAHLRPTGTRRR